MSKNIDINEFIKKTGAKQITDPWKTVYRTKLTVSADIDSLMFKNTSKKTFKKLLHLIFTESVKNKINEL